MSLVARIVLSLSLAPEPLLRDPDAQAAFEAAQEAFEAKDYAEASKQLERAYMSEPEVELLYPWAQAERNLGHCPIAIDLYQRFIDGGPSERMIEAAKQNIARCEESIAAGGATDPDPIEPDPGEADAGSDDEPPPPRTAAAVDKGPDDPKPVGRDVAGGVLVGVGGVAVVVGAALLGTASKQAKVTGDAQDNSTYLDMRARAKTLNTAGIAMLATGGVLVVAGVVRYGVLARKRKNADVALWWDRGGGGLAMTGRF